MFLKMKIWNTVREYVAPNKGISVNFKELLNIKLNPLPPSDAVRQQKEMFLRIFSAQYRLNFFF